MKFKIKIDGMSCPHCQKRVEELLSGLSGAVSTSVNLENREAVLETISPPDEKKLIALLDDDGYTFLQMEALVSAY